MSRTSLTFSSALAALALTVAFAATGCAAESEEPDAESEEALSGMPSFPSPSDFPTESEWALGRIRRACGVSLAGAVGKITRSPDGVYYSATINGVHVPNANAYAKNDTIFARAVCLGAENPGQ